MRALILALFLTGCAGQSHQSHILIGTARPPTDPALVRLYVKPPAQYEEIALVDATSMGAYGDQAKVNKVIERLKAEAAALGANGVLLAGVSNESSGSVGTAYVTGNTALGVSGNAYRKLGKGLAIYVP